MARKCPQCQESLKGRTIDGVQVDSCPVCAGIWFDEGELRRLRTLDPAALPMLEEETIPQCERAEAASSRRCPCCDRVLDQFRYLYDSPVILDTCGACGGLWVEEGELCKMDQILIEKRRLDSPREQAALAIANLAFDHDREVLRQKRLRSLFAILRSRPPYFHP